LRIPKFKLKRRNIIIRSIRITKRRFQSQAAPLNNILMVNVSKNLRPLMLGMSQPCQIPLMDLTPMETLLSKNLSQHATLTNRLRANAPIRNPQLTHMISQQTMERVDGNTRVTLTMLNKSPFQLATHSRLLKVNAPIRNPLPIHMTSQLITERVDGSTKVTLTTSRRNPSQLALPNNILMVNANKNQRSLMHGMYQLLQKPPTDLMPTEILLSKTQSQLATHSRLLRVSAPIRNLLLIHMIFLLTMERVDGNTKETLITPRKNQSQAAPLNNISMVSANKNLRQLILGMSQPCQIPPTDHMLTETLLNKTQFQHATHSRLLRASVPIRNLLLTHMTSQPIMERVDGNTKVTPTMCKKNQSQPVPLNNISMVNANKNQRSLMLGMYQLQQKPPMDHMPTEILPNKTQFQPATPSRLLKVNVPIRNPLLIHMTSQLITERVDGNIRVTPTMSKGMMSQDVTPLSTQLVNARTKFLLLLHQLTKIQRITRCQTSVLIMTSRLPSPTWIMLKRSLEPGLYQRRRIRKLLLKSQRMLHLKRRVIQFAQAPDAQSQRRTKITQLTTQFQTLVWIVTSKTLSNT